MTKLISRREFLKLAGLGAVAAAALTGCGPAARYVTRRPYTEMPEYNQTGVSTYYATGCRECPAGCGLIVRTQEGRALKVEGNPNHPVNRGKVCPRGLTTVQGLYNPDRIQAPRHYPKRGAERYETLEWPAAIRVLSEAIAARPQAVEMLFGLTDDHLYDLATEAAQVAGLPQPLRWGVLGAFDGQRTLAQAAGLSFSQGRIPYFDLAEADFILSFGANFLETWLSPLTYSRAYGQMRRGQEGRRGYWVAFEPRQSLTSANADEWIAIVPGSEGLLAQALARLAAEQLGAPVPAGLETLDTAAAAAACGVPLEKLIELSRRFVAAQHPLAIAGGGMAGHVAGRQAVQAALTLNALAGNLGAAGGVWMSAAEPTCASLQELQGLVQRMKAGQVQVLLVHGVNPVFELPAALGFEQALENVPLVISFASFPDETALRSDYILPDHVGLESWGYQRYLPGADRTALTAFQPVVTPLYDTRATVDVLLSAFQAVGAALPYRDEIDFLQLKVLPLMQQEGAFQASDLPTFWSRFLQYGGWWQKNRALDRPRALLQPPAALDPAALPALKPGMLHLMVYPTTQFGDGSGANRPWLQEMPDPMTTVTWRPWVEIHPHTADELGLKDDDVVRIESAAGAIEAVVYRYPAIRPDTVALPFGQGHSALGRYAAGRGQNPANLFEVLLNEAGELAYGDTQVRVIPTGKHQPLARVESRAGVYGEH